MHEPTAVGVAERETGLGCRQLVEVVQPNHVRHLKLCLYGESRARGHRRGADFPKKAQTPGPKKRQRHRFTSNTSFNPNFSFTSSSAPQEENREDERIFPPSRKAALYLRVPVLLPTGSDLVVQLRGRNGSQEGGIFSRDAHTIVYGARGSS